MNRETRENREKIMDCEIHEKILYKDECYIIQGAVFEVYREMGCGFLEAVYQECLEIELSRRGVPYDRQVALQLSYKDKSLKQTYIPDLICFGEIIVEIKAVKELASEHQAQLLNYLKATDSELGLLINFGSYPKVQIRRMANQFSRLNVDRTNREIRETRERREEDY